MLLLAYSQLSSPLVEQVSKNSLFLHVLSSVLSAQIYALYSRQCIDIIFSQCERIRKTLWAEQIVALENEFRFSKQYETGISQSNKNYKSLRTLLQVRKVVYKKNGNRPTNGSRM